MRLQALDFWLRNPDYVAYEIACEVEAGKRDRADLRIAERILDDDEPDLRRFPMIRYLFGAYEPLDDALALLRMAGFISIRRIQGGRGGVWRHDYYLLSSGEESAERLVAEAPALNWYAERATLVAGLARDAGGAELKSRQYEQLEYAHTQLGSRITPISTRVRDKLAAMNSL
jgi:hypothetical protein